MKVILVPCLTVASVCFSLADDLANDARIIGEISDGRPAPPAPKVEPPTFRIERSHAHQSGERQVTVHQVIPPGLEPVPEKPRREFTPEEKKAREEFLNSEEFIRLQEEEREKWGSFCILSATHFVGGPTFLRWSYGDADFEAWSNINFNHLGGFNEFEGRGQKFVFIMALGNVGRAAQERQKESLDIPVLPELSESGPVYMLTKGDGTDEKGLLMMDALHDLYEKESERLKIAHQERRRNRILRAEELRKNPPKKKNEEVFMWKMNRQE